MGYDPSPEMIAAGSCTYYGRFMYFAVYERSNYDCLTQGVPENLQGYFRFFPNTYRVFAVIYH